MLILKSPCALLVILFLCNPVWSETFSVSSPDHKLVITAELTDTVTYSVKFEDKLLISPSQLGMIFNYQAVGNQPQALLGHKSRTGRERFHPVAGKTHIVDSAFNELTLDLKNQTNPALEWRIVFRVYNEGVAFRYELLPKPEVEAFTLQWELTQFRFAGNYACHGLNLGKFANGHEGEFDPVAAAKIRTHHLFDAPLVCMTGEQETTIALAESNLKNYAGAYFTGLGDGGLGVQVQLTPRFDEDKSGLRNVAVKGQLSPDGFTSPWRVLMVGASPLALIESNLINLLAEPSTIKDTSWIQPGKVAWDWWNDNQVAVQNTGMNTATYRAYTDFAATLGLEFILVDAGWYPGSSYQSVTEADVTKSIPAMDIPKIVDYAASKGVGVWLWVQWKQLDRQMQSALSTYQQWGIKGIKVDFMDRFDQEMVDYYHKLLSMSAEHKLMVNLHGAFPPTGLAKTYPNFLTQEGVLGAEYNKWSNRITATHNVTLPFTRMLLGPMDYTPGGFRHIPSTEFPSRIRNTLPFVQTTRGQALAMYVIYESPLQMLSDSPLTYSQTDGDWPQPKNEWQPGLEFIATVPVTWDETRALQGKIGEFIVMARRKGDTWYLGAMTNEQGRKLSIPLDFLGSGQYELTTWQDGEDMSQVKRDSLKRSEKHSLKLTLSPSGGAVAIIKPVLK